MAINLQLKTKVHSAFNSAIVSNVRNGITVGGSRGTARGATGSNGLQGDLPSASAPQMAMREPGNIPAPGGRAPTRGDVPARLQRSPQPGPSGAEPLHPSTPRTGSGETDAAIREAAQASGVDVNTMRGIASIESDMNPRSNRNRHTQYKGLYQLGHEEWGRHGSGNVYNAHDNAMATARMFEQHKAEFRSRFGRDPTDRELYMIHQQGLGFYTRGAMTNIRGNPYPGMHGPQTHESFEAGWGRELERRKAGFAKSHPSSNAQGSRGAPVPEPDVGPQSSLHRPMAVASASPSGMGVSAGGSAKSDPPEASEDIDSVDLPPAPSAPQASPEELERAKDVLKDFNIDFDTPSGIYPPTPGDKNDPAKTGKPDQFSMPSDYDQG